MNHTIRNSVIFFAATLISTGTLAQIHAEEHDYINIHRANTVTSEPYVSPEAVVSEQSQLVYYYPEENHTRPLNIYLDKEFHTALLPGEFTTFCIKAGPHLLNAAINDAPLYQQKAAGGINSPFEGGKTYFIRAAQYQKLVSEPVSRGAAEEELRDLRRNSRIINRASSVESCRYSANRSVDESKTSLFFKFAGSSEAKIENASKNKFKEIISRLKNSRSITSIHLAGSTDDIGMASNNQRLSEARAETVRRMLINAGIDGSLITARGNGVDPLAVECGSLPDESCNQQSRRVDIIINAR